MSECDIIDPHSGDVQYTFKYEGVSKILVGTNAICMMQADGSMMVVPLQGQYLVRLSEEGQGGLMHYA